MVSKAFQKGFIDGFLSPFTFFMPPEKRRSAPDYQLKAANIKQNALEKELKELKELSESYGHVVFTDADILQLKLLFIRRKYDVSPDAAWREAGQRIFEAMKQEAGKIDAERKNAGGVKTSRKGRKAAFNAAG